MTKGPCRRMLPRINIYCSPGFASSCAPKAAFHCHSDLVDPFSSRIRSNRPEPNGGHTDDDDGRKLTAGQLLDECVARVEWNGYSSDRVSDNLFPIRRSQSSVRILLSGRRYFTDLLEEIYKRYNANSIVLGFIREWQKLCRQEIKS